MATYDPEQPLTEPLIIPDLAVTGIDIQKAESVVRFVGWVAAPSEGQPTERRIVTRFVMAIEAARALHKALGAAVRREGH